MKSKKVKVSELKLGPIRNEVLPEGFIFRVQRYKEKLKEVETISLEETISNFQRDLHPERELRIWEVIAEQYEAETKANPNWTLKKKKDYLGKLLFSTAS